MFDNCSSKIKTVAYIFFWLDAITTLVGAIILWASGEGLLVLLGFVLLIGGIFSSFAMALLIYGFGHLIENSNNISKSLAEQKEHIESEKKSFLQTLDGTYSNQNNRIIIADSIFILTNDGKTVRSGKIEKEGNSILLIGNDGKTLVMFVAENALITQSGSRYSKE